LKQPRPLRSKRPVGRQGRDEEKENAGGPLSLEEKEKRYRASSQRNELKGKQILKSRSQDSRKALKDITGPYSKAQNAQISQM